MFRFAVAILAGLGLGALLFGGGEWTAAGVGLVLLAPVFLVFKLFLFLALFGLVSRAMWRHKGGSPWNHPGHPYRRRRTTGSTGEAETDDTDRFEEWHRMAHARDEVDSWTADDV